MDKFELKTSMDAELWEELTPQEQDTWNALKDLQDHVGFRLLKQDLQYRFDTLLLQQRNSTSWEQFCFIKGQLDVLNAVINVQAQVAAQLHMNVVQRGIGSVDEETATEAVEDFV